MAFRALVRAEAGRSMRRMDRRVFLGAAAAALVSGPLRALPSAARAEVPAGAKLLRAVYGGLTVDGKTGKVYRLEQESGMLGWSGRGDERFRVVVENAIAEPFAIHWHGLLLPNGQDGVPYVTQSPIRPGERRLYDFPSSRRGPTGCTRTSAARSSR